MILFIKNIFRFAVPLLLVAVLLELVLRSLPNSYDIKNSLIEDNAPKIEVMLFGTSHTFGGINPAQFDKFTVNIANNSQSLYYDLMILEKYLDKLPSLKTVVFEINFFSLSYNLDRGPESWRNKFYYQSFDIEPQSSSLNFFDKIRLFNLTSSEIILLFKNYTLNQEYQSNYGFAKNDIIPKKINESTAKFKFDQFKNDYMNSAPTTLKELLNKSLKKLSKRGIQVVFVQIPVSSFLCDIIQESNIQSELGRLDEFITQYNITYLDYSCNQAMVDSLFVDTDHLSYKGAKIFTNLLIRDLHK